MPSDRIGFTHGPLRSARCTIATRRGASPPSETSPPDAGRAAGRRGAGAPPSEASIQKLAPAKPALERDRAGSAAPTGGQTLTLGAAPRRGRRLGEVPTQGGGHHVDEEWVMSVAMQ